MNEQEFHYVLFDRVIVSKRLRHGLLIFCFVLRTIKSCAVLLLFFVLSDSALIRVEVFSPTYKIETRKIVIYVDQNKIYTRNNTI